jgi:hypothetical protein
MLHDGDFSSLERPTQIKEWLGGDG